MHRLTTGAVLAIAALVGTACDRADGARQRTILSPDLTRLSATRTPTRPSERGTPPVVPLTRLSSTPHAYDRDSGFDDPAYVVVRDTSTWRQVWNQYASVYVVGAPGRPVIDFSREMVVMAALGRSGPVSDVVVDSAYYPGDSIEVVVHTLAFGGGSCGTTGDIVHPVDFAKIPALPSPVRFREVTRTVTC
jgi:hypothetical protein